MKKPRDLRPVVVDEEPEVSPNAWQAIDRRLAVPPAPSRARQIGTAIHQAIAAGTSRVAKEAGILGQDIVKEAIVEIERRKKRERATSPAKRTSWWRGSGRRITIIIFDRW